MVFVDEAAAERRYYAGAEGSTRKTRKQKVDSQYHLSLGKSKSFISYYYGNSVVIIKSVKKKFFQ